MAEAATAPDEVRALTRAGFVELAVAGRSIGQREVPLHEGATHCFVSATLTRSSRHPVGRVVGDLLVLEPSASGRCRRLAFREEHGHHLGGANHFALLNHPAVYERLRDWLG